MYMCIRVLYVFEYAYIVDYACGWYVDVCTIYVYAYVHSCLVFVACTVVCTIYMYVYMCVCACVHMCLVYVFVYAYVVVGDVCGWYVDVCTIYECI